MHAGRKIVDPAITELRSIELREMELDAEKEQLRRRRLEILELDQGARKSGRKMLTRENRKALFTEAKRIPYEHGKAQ